MNYTEKYHLPQWEESDRVMRTDFNQMCATIENSIKSAAQAAETAQSTANSAKGTAETALAHKNYVTGTYGGTGNTHTITLGFKPAAVIVSTYPEGDCSLHLANSSMVMPVEGGFQLTYQNVGATPSVNERNGYYFYIAFR